MDIKELEIVKNVASKAIDESLNDGVGIAIEIIKMSKNAVEEKKGKIPLDYYHGVVDTCDFIIKVLQNGIDARKK